MSVVAFMLCAGGDTEIFFFFISRARGKVYPGMYLLRVYSYQFIPTWCNSTPNRKAVYR